MYMRGSKLETEFGLRAAADSNNTGGEAFTSFAAGHFIIVIVAQIYSLEMVETKHAALRGGFCPVAFFLCRGEGYGAHLTLAAGLQCEGFALARLRGLMLWITSQTTRRLRVRKGEAI